MIALSACIAWISCSSKPLELWHTFTGFLKISSFATDLFGNTIVSCKNFGKKCKQSSQSGTEECLNCCAKKSRT